MVALVLVAGLALAAAAPADSTQPPVTAQAALVNATQAADAPAADPYLAGSPFTTEAPEPIARCQVFAYQCVFDGGPCGPGGVCHCQFNPGGDWICAR
jgi:hypothetical protein